MQEDGQNRCEEEQDGVHDSKCPGCGQHPAVLRNVVRPLRSSLFAIVTERTDRHVDTRSTEVFATGVVDATKLVDSSDEGTDEAEIDEGNEEG